MLKPPRVDGTFGSPNVVRPSELLEQWLGLVMGHQWPPKDKSLQVLQLSIAPTNQHVWNKVITLMELSKILWNLLWSFEQIPQGPAKCMVQFKYINGFLNN